MTSATIDLDAISSLEESVYKEGFSEGEAHGKLHGTFEGRQLGKEKGFELWQELGQMEGFARTYLRQSKIEDSNTPDLNRKRQKGLQHLQSLIGLIDSMPMENDDQIDIGAHLEKIRAKYKLAFLALNLNQNPSNSHLDQRNQNLESSSTSGTNVTIKGRQVDSSQLHF